MATGVAIAALVIFGLVAGFFPGWSPGDRLALFGLGALVAGLMWRYASIRVDVTADGLVVRNLILTTPVPWDNIVDFEFHDGDAWPHLVLADHDTLAVMAIQRSDGAVGRENAVRLAELLEPHVTGGDQDDDADL